MNLIDKACGAMLGQACGDALGVLAENIPLRFDRKIQQVTTLDIPLPLEKLIKETNTEDDLNILQQYIDHMALPGLYTDDTQQAILLAWSLINNQGVEQEDIAGLWVKGARIPTCGELGIFRQAGSGFKQVVQNLMIFTPPNKSGVKSAGNGAAMRISPVGVFFKNDIDNLLKATIDISIISHHDIRGIAAAGLVAYSVAYLLNTSRDNFNIEDFIYNLQEFVRELENVIIADYKIIEDEIPTRHQVSSAIDTIVDISSLSHTKALAVLDKLAQKASGRNNCWHNSPFVLGSVIFSLYIFISQGMNMEKAVLTAVNGGGDADTIGAIVGTMCGALHGYQKIPANWLNSLLNIEFLKQLGAALITRQPVSENPLEIEKHLCKREIAFRHKYRQMLNKTLGYN